MEKEEIKKKEGEITHLAVKFCVEKLNDEYAELAVKLVRKLGRKRNVPFATGKSNIWAAAVIHAIGSINFLFDKSQMPHISVEEMNNWFETKAGTVTGKSKVIRDMFKMDYFNDEFLTKSMMELNPMNNYVLVDGMITPLDCFSEEMQEKIRKIRAEGGDVSFISKE